MKSFFILFLLNLVFSAFSIAADTSPQSLNKSLAVTPIAYNSGDKQHSKQYIVQFEDDSVIKKTRSLTAAKKQKRVFASSVQQSSISTSVDKHKKLLAQKRASFMSAIKKKHGNAKILREYSSILNGVSVATELSLKQIKNMDNVKAVYPVRRYKNKMSNLLPIIDVPESWTLLGGKENAGKGMKIAVIDSGIIEDHPMFDDVGITAPSSLPTDDYCRTTDPSFCNNKLIVARYYLPDFINLTDTGDYDSPKALSGHGSHVAGIATGRQVTASNGDTISGVAPGAYLMVYKALWGQDGEGSDVELLAAMDDAVRDGADVINNSWGSGSGTHPSASLYKELYEELEAKGVVIVTAAGNEGNESDNDNSKSISCPGCVEAGITVGATTTDLSSGLPVTFSDKTLYATPSDNGAINTDINAKVGLATSNNRLGCNAWSSNQFNGLIAVVTRGSCDFEVKAELAKNSGAVALIVINDELEANITMFMGTATLPAVLVSKSDGKKLIEAFTNSPNMNLIIGANFVKTMDSNLQDWIADFSSLGPNGDDSFIKPDIAAPGVGILSATSNKDLSSLGEDYARFNGTSMATPAVAGAAVLLKQHAPELSAIEIKNVLINSSDSVVKNRTGNKAATAFETGAGRLNVINALNATTYAKQPNMVAKSCVIDCSISNELITFSDTNTTWTADIKFDDENIIAQVSPSQLALSSTNKSGSFTININASSVVDEDWYFGRIQWTNNTGGILNQAIAISNEQANSDLLQLTVTNNGSTTKSIQLVSNNVSSDEEVTLDLSISGDAHFVNNTLSITGGANQQITDQLEKQITVLSNVNLGRVEFTNESAPIIVNLETDGVTPIACELKGCDEVSYKMPFNFKHFNQDFTSLYMNDNGLIIAGDDIPEESDLATNLSFPNNTVPNNIIAPFWTDFNLINFTEPGDEGGGEMFAKVYETSGIEYLVLQWNKVQLYSNIEQGITLSYLGVSRADLEFTFQLILQENSDNKWFRYLDIPEQPNFYSVGTENSAGSQGGTYWFDGTGTSSVTNGDSIAVTLGQAGTLTLNVDVAIKSFSLDDRVSVPAKQSLAIDVLANDSFTTEGALLTSIVSGVEHVTPLFVSDKANELDKKTLTITSAPANGQAVIGNDSLITYTPDDNFSGEDQFSYSIKNDLGEVSTSNVNIEVSTSNVNIEAVGKTKKKDKGFLGLPLNGYLQGLLILLLLSRRFAGRQPLLS